MNNRADLYRAEGVSFALQGRRLLDVGSLRIGEGGICCLAGPNGAGKTLLLSLLAGLIIPDRGTVSYRGLEMDAAVRDRIMGREVTMMHQHPFLFRGTVLSNVTYGMREGFASRREREHEGERLLEKVGLTGFGRRRSGRLSAGERSRVALARALACGAHTLLLDEPTASIDRDGTALVEELLATEASAGGRTVIMSTHSREQAGRLGGRMLFVREGRVLRLEPESGAGEEQNDLEDKSQVMCPPASCKHSRPRR